MFSLARGALGTRCATIAPLVPHSSSPACDIRRILTRRRRLAVQAGKSKPKYSRETVLCTFKKDKALKKAIELNGTSFQDAVIRVGLNVEPVREAKRAEGSERIFVGNLPWDMTVEKVRPPFPSEGVDVHAAAGCAEAWFGCALGYPQLPRDSSTHPHADSPRQRGGRERSEEVLKHAVY